MNLQKIYTYIDTHREPHFQKLKKMLLQPSVSPQNIGVRDCAELLAKFYEELHCETEIFETEGNPVVYGKYDCGASKTLLAYFMYDTQPFDEPGWSYPPMEATLAPLDLPSGKVTALYNRGAINSKGPMMTFLNAIESILKTEGELPFNLLLVAEGAELIRSKLSSQNTAILGMIFIVFLLINPVVDTYNRLSEPHFKEEIKPVIEYVLENQQDGDVLYIYYSAVPAFEYYSARYGYDSNDYIRGVSSRDNLVTESQGLYWKLYQHQIMEEELMKD